MRGAVWLPSNLISKFLFRYGEFIIFSALREGVERGFHAHKDLQQIAIAVTGSCEIILDDGEEQKSVLLDNSTKGLYIGPGFWRVMCNFTPDCVLLVLADQHYDESDYIRSYDEFLKWKKK